MIGCRKAEWFGEDRDALQRCCQTCRSTMYISCDRDRDNVHRNPEVTVNITLVIGLNPRSSTIPGQIGALKLANQGR